MYQDLVAVQLLPRNQWVAPSSIVLQDEGAAKDDNEEDKDEEAESVSWTEINCFWTSTSRWRCMCLLMVLLSECNTAAWEE